MVPDLFSAPKVNVPATLPLQTSKRALLLYGLQPIKIPARVLSKWPFSIFPRMLPPSSNNNINHCNNVFCTENILAAVRLESNQGHIFNSLVICKRSKFHFHLLLRMYC